VVDQGGHAGAVLHDNPRRMKIYFNAVGVTASQPFKLVLGDAFTILVTGKVFKEKLDAKGHFAQRREKRHGLW